MTINSDQWIRRIAQEHRMLAPFELERESCAQVLFFKSDAICECSYKHRDGKYQGRMGVTLPKA